MGCLLLGDPGAVKAADEPVLLDVFINGFDTQKIAAFTLRGAALLATRDEMASIGLRVPLSVASGTDGLIDMRALPKTSWRLDMPTQTIYLTVADARLLPQELGPGAALSENGAAESGLGATLNYDVNGTSLNNQRVGSALFDLRAFSPWGIASTGLLAYAGGGTNGRGSNSQVRLDSVYTFSNPETLRQYSVGDFITGGLDWTRPVRFGGLQIDSNFSLRPDLVTFPLPSVSGSVAVPSTIDVLVNGNRLMSRQIAAGPFQISQLPVLNGAGTVSMTVTNALGLPTVVNLPFYASSDLLSPGLQTYSAQLGAVRNDWGTVSNDYGALAASATYRRGVFPWLTVQASAEATPGTVAAGGGVVVNLDNLAVLDLALGGSTGSGHADSGIATPAGNTTYQPDVTGRDGGLVSIGIQRIGRVFSLGTSVTVASHNYRDIAAMNGVPYPRLQLSANAGLSLGRFGSLGIGYAVRDSDAAANPVAVYIPLGTTVTGITTSQDGATFFQPAEKEAVVTLSYSVEIAAVSFYATGFYNSVHGGASGVLLGLTIPLGFRSSASASAGAGAGGFDGEIQVQQSATKIGEWGYQAVGTSDDHAPHEFAQVNYESPWSMVTVGADHISGQTTYHAEAQGAVSLVDGGLFFSNTIPDAFAVVDTNGLKGVHVLQENRVVGVTDAAGQLLVPNLRSFDLNNIGIDPADIPEDASIDSTTMEVRPQERSGVVARFDVRFSHGALLQIVDEKGASIPIGSTAALQPAGAPVPVGYDGDAYVEFLGRHNLVVVTLPDGAHCQVTFAYQPARRTIPTIGPLTCIAQGQ